MTWQPLTRPPPTLQLLCWECGERAVNISGHLAGWEQSSGRPRLYRCPSCASLDQPVALFTMPDPPRDAA